MCRIELIAGPLKPRGPGETIYKMQSTILECRCNYLFDSQIAANEK